MQERLLLFADRFLLFAGTDAKQPFYSVRYFGEICTIFWEICTIFWGNPKPANPHHDRAKRHFEKSVNIYINIYNNKAGLPLEVAPAFLYTETNTEQAAGTCRGCQTGNAPGCLQGVAGGPRGIGKRPTCCQRQNTRER